MKRCVVFQIVIFLNDRKQHKSIQKTKTKNKKPIKLLISLYPEVAAGSRTPGQVSTDEEDGELHTWASRT